MRCATSNPWSVLGRSVGGEFRTFNPQTDALCTAWHPPGGGTPNLLNPMQPASGIADPFDTLGSHKVGQSEQEITHRDAVKPGDSTGSESPPARAGKDNGEV